MSFVDEERNRRDKVNAALTGSGLLSVGDTLGFLSSLQNRPEAKGLYYNGKQVTLDGYTFISCRFDNCTLVVSSLNFNLINCIIDPTTKITYGASVTKIIQLFNSRYPWSHQHFPPPFVPEQNEDGTITISDHTK